VTLPDKNPDAFALSNRCTYMKASDLPLLLCLPCPEIGCPAGPGDSTLSFSDQNTGPPGQPAAIENAEFGIHPEKAKE